MAAGISTGAPAAGRWRRRLGAACDLLRVSGRDTGGMGARLVFSAVVFCATLPYSNDPAPFLWMAAMAALAVAEARASDGAADLFAWMQSAGYALAGFYLTFFQIGAAQTFGVTLYGVVMFEILVRDYARPRRLLTNLTPMLISMVVVQLGAGVRLVERDQPWRIATVLATTYLVFRVFRSLQIDLTRARRDLAEARGRAEADARRIREAHRIALMAEGMAGVGHWRVDLASGETTWSEGVFRIYGREPSAGVPNLGTQMAHFDVADRRRWRAGLKIAAKTGEPFEFEARLRRMDGAARHVVCHAAVELGADGEAATLFGALMDVTEARAREVALLDAKLRAEAAAEAKAEFLANMSHEIRTPLTAINGFSSLLSDLHDLPPDAGLYVRRVKTAGMTLLTVVNDILEFSKLESGHVALSPQPFAVAPFLDDVMALFAEQARAKSLALSLDLDPGVPAALEADANRLRQVIVNLVSNAIKFTETGEVRLSVRHADGVLRVSVRDTGCGVPEDKRDGLFQRFFQIDGSNSRRYGGTGLGLSICKGLVELMGGSITMESAPGGGSIFAFDIHAQEAAPAPTGVSAERAGPVARAQILVVDDVAVNRELVRAMLQAVGHEVSEAASASEALRLTACERFDLILMDLQMPEVDGFAAARAVRAQDSANRDTPIIALSADVLPEHVEASAQAGMNGHIGKPISPLELLGAIERWSGSRAPADGAVDRERKIPLS
ncbi:ATP-binding protein [Caulobacter sp. UNC279MFTsu5.1]|uniref:hybrid sensor histidine kinase/response regulator n=1 Tax=Caulobacter sp. UNC279MFTsu5.1 TaxID=1502775 RepID=UPI0008F3FD3E|nr:ATP-binding protein [Caulobacter sp. UNC279MFTsu5.1]SFK44879.1 Signal transduction histidine kinase [Caulobacter sp. UNC279MFTsu5.1]